MPPLHRLGYVAFCLLTLYTGLELAMTGEITTRMKGSGRFHFHGGPAWLLYAGMLCAAAAMLAFVLDHFDERDNERSYQAFAQWCFGLCVVCFVAAWIWFFATKV